MILTVTTPLGSIPYQILGSNKSLALVGTGAAKPERAYPSMDSGSHHRDQKTAARRSAEPLSPWADKLTITHSSHP
jgi:hypothetical protein